MVMVDINGKKMYSDGYSKTNLDDLKLAIEKNWDGVGFYCGYEGDGKTTKAAQDCVYMDPTINMERVAFTPQQFIKIIENAKPKQAVLFDEGHAAFNAKQFRDKAQQAIISMLTRIRKKRLFIAIVSPTFFDINKYIIIHRSRYMVRIYANGLTRGFFGFYGRDTKHKLYVLGYKTENILVVNPDFRGRFTSFFPFDWDEYNTKKEAAEIEMLKRMKGPSRRAMRFYEMMQSLVAYCHDTQKMQFKSIVDWINNNSPQKISLRHLQRIYHMDRTLAYEGMEEEEQEEQKEQEKQEEAKK